MSTASLLRLIFLAAIWGSSFLFMRISAPELGPVALMVGRFAFATLFLCAVAFMVARPVSLRHNTRNYVIQGLVGATIPFLLFGYAAQTLPASLLSIINATAPIWGAVLGAIFGGHRPTPTTLAGLALGVAGVALLMGLDPAMLAPGAPMAALAALAATFCYSVATLVVQRSHAADPLATALGCMLVSTLAVAPVTPFYLPDAMPPPLVIFSVAMLGIVCSGVAYLVYFRLIADIGAASALTVTFLIPVFGVLWGAVFLHEEVGLHTLAGSVITLIGTALVTGFRPRWPRRKAAT